MSHFDGESLRRQFFYILKKWMDIGGKREFYLSETEGDRQVLTAWFTGFLRGIRLWDAWIEIFCKHPPKRDVKIFLQASISSVWNADKDYQPIQVNEWVRLAKKMLSLPESRMINAILRRLLREGQPLLDHWKKNRSTWGTAWSHPDWLVDRWINQWGSARTLAILEWNQTPSKTYFRGYGEHHVLLELEETPWNRFYTLPKNSQLPWKDWLERGWAYIQDPATRIAPESLKGEPEGDLMEWCASPGGKSLLLADQREQMLQKKESPCIHLAVDLPGEKGERLRQNLNRYPHGRRISVLESDVLSLSSQQLQKLGYPALWDTVFVDAPCSNTGVLARKPEVRYRLSPEDFTLLTQLQDKMLCHAGQFVKPGGKLLYSTCSIDVEENAQRATAFLKNRSNWTVIHAQTWIPPERGHDGGGFFLMQRNEKD